MTVWEDFLKIDGWKSCYASVDRALRHYARQLKSERTKENFSITLMLFCGFSGLDPDSLVALESGEASRRCQEFTDSLKEKDYSVRYVNVSQAFLRTFFKTNGFEGERELKVERYHQPSRYRKKPEYIPTPEEIYRIGYASNSSKNRAMVFMLYTSGLRNSTLRAVRYGDLRRELDAGLEAIKVSVYPEMKKVDPGACKSDLPYVTFIEKETIKAIREYLAERAQVQGGIKDDEPLFCSDSNQVPQKDQRFTPVSKNGLERMVKRAAKQAGVERWKDVVPHCLRKAFESALRNNRLDPKDQEFLMGHLLPGSQDAYYDRTKTEELRKKYLQVKFFPQSGGDVEELRKKQILDMVRVLNYPEDKIKRVEEALAKSKTVDDAMGEIKKLSLDGHKVTDDQGHDPKKIIDEADLEEHLAYGWDVQTILKSGRILVSKIV